MSSEHHSHGSRDTVQAELSALVARLPPSTDRRLFLLAIQHLAQKAASHGRAAAVFHDLVMSTHAGARVALEYLLKLPDPLPLVLTAAAVPVLKDEGLPLPLRMACAGKLLDAVPDDPQTVQPVVQAVTQGLSKSKRLERLMHLQRMVASCETLDVIVETTEQGTKLTCPRCDKRFTRAQLISHLWHKHELLMIDRQAVSPRVPLDALITKAATDRTPELFDEAFFASEVYFPNYERRLVFQALTARGEAEPGELEQLLALAKKRHAGLCPVCLTAVAVPVVSLPPPANIYQGRVSAEGFEVYIRDLNGNRTATIERTPGDSEGIEVSPKMTRRLAATLVAAFVGFLGFVAVILTPSTFVAPWLVVLLSVTLIVAAYTLIYFTRVQTQDSTELALYHAWADLTPGLGRSDRAVQFLIRLARASLTRGEPTPRSPFIYDLALKAETLASRSTATTQLAATVQLLLVFDRIRMGTSKLSAVAELFVDVFTGARNLIYAETLAELLLTDGDLRRGDTQRVGVMVVALAFQKGWTAHDLVTVSRFLPHFSRLCGATNPEGLSLSYTLSEFEDRQLWERLGGAELASDFAAEQPTLARPLFAGNEQLLLKLHLKDELEAEVGPVVLTTDGPMISNIVISDAKIHMECSQIEQGMYRLTLGEHRLPMRRRMPTAFFTWLRAWTKYAARLHYQSRLQPKQLSEVAAQQIRLLAVPCPVCDYVSFHLPGQTGTPTQGIVAD